VSSYLTISPLLLIQRAVCFCGTFRRVTPPGRYPAPCPVELGLSSLIFTNQSSHPVYLAHNPLYTSTKEPSNLGFLAGKLLQRLFSQGMGFNIIIMSDVDDGQVVKLLTQFGSLFVKRKEKKVPHLVTAG
jgi:hypothetical protein